MGKRTQVPESICRPTEVALVVTSTHLYPVTCRVAHCQISVLQIALTPMTSLSTGSMKLSLKQARCDALTSGHCVYRPCSQADMANTVSKKPERPAMDTYGTSHEDLEAAFQMDVARGRRVTVQPTKGLNAANAVDPDTTAAAAANTATAYADAAAAAAAIADAEAEDDVITAAAAAKAAAAAAADAAFEAEAAAAAAAAAEAKDAAVAAAVAAAAAKKDTQMEFAFEDPERSAKSMKEDWGNDGWEEQLEGVDYLGAGLEDDDDAFAGSGGNYDFLGNGKLFGGDGDGGAVSSSSGSGVGLPDDDDTVEADEELDAAEWEFDALDDVDGSYDDDVDNVAEAFAQGEYDKASEVPSEDLVRTPRNPELQILNPESLNLSPEP